MKLILGDCIEKMRELPTATIDAVICDPPFGTTACKWDSVIPFEPMWEEIERITKIKSAVVFFGVNPFSANLVMSNPKAYRYDWIWRKQRGTGHLNAKKQPMRDAELVHVFYREQASYNPQNLKPGYYNNGRPAHAKSGSLYGKQIKPDATTITNYPKTVLEFNKVSSPIHPTQKPTDLLEYLVRTHTNPGDIVLDFTMGSGSTGVACVNTDRLFIGIEKDEGYFEIAKKRIADAQAAKLSAQRSLPEVPA